MKIKRGNIVEDLDGYKGVVVEIDTWNDEPLSIENHGTISVWQIDRMNYDADNCEHYPYYNWHNLFKIVDATPVEYE